MTSEATETATEGQASGDQTSGDQTASTNVEASKSAPTAEQESAKPSDAVASNEKTEDTDRSVPAPEKPKAWVDRVVNAGHSILWPQSTMLALSPTLLTGVKMGNEDCLVDDLMDWERRLENANLDNHQQFLRNAQLAVCVTPPYGSNSLGKWVRARSRRHSF